MLAEVQPYVRRERRAFELLARVQAERSPRFIVDDDEPAAQ
jgi:hypothetical protein